MAHGITKVDKGMIGYVEVFGEAWHRLKQYVTKDGAIELAEAREILGYEVGKVPCGVCLLDEEGDVIDADLSSKLLDMHGHLIVMPDTSEGGHDPSLHTDDDDEGEKDDGRMYALYRLDTKTPVYRQSVSSTYKIFQNVEFLDNIDNLLLKRFPNQLAIESVGTLWGGRITFVNLLLDRFHIKGDHSETCARIMYYNAFGGCSVGGCSHFTRIVCNNTFNLATAQGATNKTLKKFRHTKGAVKRVAEHLVDLAEIDKAIQAQRQVIERMAEVPMTVKDTENLMGTLFPITEKAGPKVAAFRKGRQDKVLAIFENAADLQGAIARTRYAMLQAVTNYSQFGTVRKGTDETANWWSAATGGDKHTLNQLAYDTLSLVDIPAPKESVCTVSELVEALNPN
jgi:hypothetical protein